MGKFDASFQIRAGLRERESTPDFTGAEEAPRIDELTAEVKAAIEARWPDFEASVAAERLDRD